VFLLTSCDVQIVGPRSQNETLLSCHLCNFQASTALMRAQQEGER